MNVLVIGSGGREHALAWKLSQSPRVTKISSCPGNGGLLDLGPCWNEPVEPGFDQLLARIERDGIDFVVIGPEQPLADGLADRLREVEVPHFGPNRQAAQLEGSKAFAKSFMHEFQIPTARYCEVRDAASIEEHLQSFAKAPVVKADGLAAGKGVFVCETHEESSRHCRDLLAENRLGAAGNRVVLEERLEGQEISLLVFVAGQDWVVLEPAQDYKRLLDGDRGPNTGGMGAYSPAEILSPEIRDQVERSVIAPTLAGLEAREIDYRGLLYLGLMLTAEGPKVLEYNVRFGDPETQPLMLRLESDLLDVFEALHAGELNQVQLSWDPRPAVCLVLASEGYPGRYEKGRAISGLPGNDRRDVQVFHAGTKQLQESEYVTSGGRVLGVTALGSTLEAARSLAYELAEGIQFEGKQYRRDIARLSAK